MTVPIKPAATVVPMRESDNGLEVLMMRRNSASEYVAGVYLFPGGAVDHADAEWTRRTHGLPDSPHDLIKGTDAALAAAHYVAAARETLEEAGLLLAIDEHGDEVQPAHATAARAAHLRGHLDVYLDTHGLRLDVSRFVYLSHWITPEGSPRRYDTRFFVGLAPSGQDPSADETETVGCEWIRPADALDAYNDKRLTMVFPTVRTLMTLQAFDTADVALQTLRESQSTVEVTAPKLVRYRGRIEVALPGDPAWSDGEPVEEQVVLPRTPQP